MRTVGKFEVTHDSILAYLNAVSVCIEQVHTWLQAHPEMLHILDAAGEVLQMEQRTNRTNLLTNLGFTLLGRLALPYIVGWFIC